MSDVVIQENVDMIEDDGIFVIYDLQHWLLPIFENEAHMKRGIKNKQNSMRKNVKQMLAATTNTQSQVTHIEITSFRSDSVFNMVGTISNATVGEDIHMEGDGAANMTCDGSIIWMEIAIWMR